MNLDITYLTNSIPSFFKETIIPSLTDRQKNILVIASLALGCLAVAYALSRCYRLKNESGDEEGTDEDHKKVPLKVRQCQELPFISFHLKRGIDNLKIANIEALSAKCFVKMTFEEGAIKKEFIIKNLTAAPIDSDFVAQQATKIMQFIQDEIQDTLGNWEKLEVTTVFQDKNNDFHLISDDKGLKGSEKSIGYSESMGIDLKDLFNIYTISIVEGMGFPSENQFKDEAFVPGALYQDLA